MQPCCARFHPVTIVALRSLQANDSTTMKPLFRNVRDSLRYVGKKNEDYDLLKFPDFLIIGPQRTGTTWLHENLAYHPQVFIPWDKELHYFNNLEYPEYHPKSLPPVDKDLEWYLEKFEIPENIRSQRMEHCQGSFHRPFAPEKYGEATATYAAGLHEGIISDILTLNPDVKIITMVRNPVDRAWSHAKKDLCKERKRVVADVPREEWLNFFNKEYQIKCGHYSQFLPLWEKMIPKENLMVGRFLDVSQKPRDVLRRVYHLIGIDAGDNLLPSEAAEPVNATQAAGIPEDLLGELQKIYGEEVSRLQDQGLI